jgi:general secretion pathway protein E
MNFDKQLYVDSGLISDELYEQVKLIATQKQRLVSDVLLSQGSVTEEALVSSFSKVFGFKQLDEQNLYKYFDELNREQENINLAFIQERDCYYFGHDDSQHYFITSKFQDMGLLHYISTLNLKYELFITTSKITREVATLISAETSLKAIDGLFSNQNLIDIGFDAPIVSLLNSMISKSVVLGASDIHIEPYNQQCRVRIRIDGVLQNLEILPLKFYAPLVSRVKIWAGMDIAEKRRPQDGKIETKAAGKSVDIRASTLPTNQGESAVLRLLLKESLTFDLDKLGVDNYILNHIKKDLEKTAGVVLLTGPTGSGKTTTLYSFLSRLNNSERKIISLEDPVEYQIEGINQIQVNADIGFTFAKGLRSILRQDPDVLMVGEIRDRETAEIAIQSSLTGHLVLSTVHTNDAPSAFVRLLDLGVDEFLINAGVVAIVAQRLIRKVCECCAKTKHYKLLSIEEKAIFNGVSESTDFNVKEAVGCKQCNNTGYKGRIAIIEYLPNSPEIQKIKKDEYFVKKAEDYMLSNHYFTLKQDGLKKVISGQTTMSEVLRVVGA